MDLNYIKMINRDLPKLSQDNLLKVWSYVHALSTLQRNEEEIKFSYENCWKYIIRPPRDNYLISELDFPFNLIEDPNFIYIRDDYTVLSKRGYLMLCSFFRADLSKRIPYIRPVVIYLHGNSSSRVEGTKMAFFLLNKGIDLFVFDFPR